jgi:tRNA-uridine 2-sulfurtransferase
VTRPPRALVAMSGGVDSSVAAAAIVDEGYDVAGVTLRLWSCDDASTESSCCNAEAVGLAQAVCDRLGIRHEILEGLATFDRRVLGPSWDEYALGRTPNPCILCNPHVKLGLLLKRADELDADWVATGHHARLRRSGGRSQLVRGADPDKDQSYFLARLESNQLERTLFPVGGMTKDQVREAARRQGLPNAERPDSQDACFAGGGEVFAEALRHRYGAAARPGAIVDLNGRVLGAHDGIHLFTVGQRRGLGISLGRPAYVVAIDPAAALVVVSTDADDLLTSGLDASAVTWLGEPVLEQPVQVQIRYRHRPVGATASQLGDDRIRVTFDQPQRAVTPGQAAVLYQGDRVLGSGWIDAALPRAAEGA